MQIHLTFNYWWMAIAFNFVADNQRLFFNILIFNLLIIFIILVFFGLKVKEALQKLQINNWTLVWVVISNQESLIKIKIE